MASSTRDDFSTPVARQVAQRAGYRCSMCSKGTLGPSDESPSKTSSTGVACHITAAAPGGPRYDPSLTPEQRSAIGNAIWMCASHSRLIDADVHQFSVARLLDLKAEHESRIKAEMAGAAHAPSRDVAAWVSETVLTWPSTLPSGTWLQRNELEQIRELLAARESGTIVLLGAPGSGKSALLARLGNTLRDEGVHVVAIKADRLPKTISTQDALAAWTGASEPLERVLRHHSLKQRTVLLVDQLDTLADLVDLETSRLDVVLDLLDSLRGVPNLQLLVSCRSFEFRHDLRMRRLNAEPIELALPSWSEVDSVLKARGLDAAGWPARLRELLLVPQQLKIFLEVEETAPPTFASYQSMLERLWSLRVKGNGSRVAIVERLADQMASDEVLEAPIAILDDLPPQALTELVAGGILQQDPTTVAFAHQSLFDFARARAFASKNLSFVDYVLQRQSGMFVRPVLWSGLTYLRGASGTRYRDSFVALWQHQDVRLHVRVLLAEFLGQLHDPSTDEVGWLFAKLDDVAVRRAAFAAMHGNSQWFERVSPRLPALMLSEWRFELAGLLAGSAIFAPTRVVDLLETHWGTIPEARQSCLYVLRFVGAWDERAVGFLIQLLTATTAEAEGLFASVAETAPRLAPRILATMLGLAFESVDASPDLSQSDTSLAHQRKYEEALGRNQDLVDLIALARDVPREYLDSVFPVFQRFSEALAIPSSPGSYRQADIGFLSEGAARLLGSVVTASETLARNEPARFLALALSASTSELAPVHQVLAAGFAALPSDHQHAALEYILADERRFRIGTGSDPDEVSAALVRATSEHISSEDARRIEAIALRSFLYESRPDASPSAKRASLSLNRAHRARLLRELPRAGLSPESTMLIAEAKGSDLASRTGRGYRPIGSPMSTEQMARASDSDLLGLFSLLPDETTWHHPRRQFLGGSVEASRAFGELAKRVPERVAALLEKLSPDTQERPVESALTALAEIGWDRSAWELLVLRCNQRGFRSEEFRWQIANAIGRRAQSESGTSDALYMMLRTWLDELPARSGKVDGSQKGTLQTEHKNQPRRSLLFGLGRGGILPRGIYPYIHGLFCGLMYRSPPDADRFLEIVERELSRNAPADEWYWVAPVLRYLSHCSDRGRAERFLDALFRQYPTVLGSEAGACLVAHSIRWVTREAVLEWITTLRAAESQEAQQAAGELLVFASSLGVELDLTVRMTSGDTSSDERVGIALAVAHEWYDQRFRARATEVLLLLLVDPCAVVRESALSVINPQEEPPLDNETRALLDLVASRRELIASVPTILFEHLHLLLPTDAERVATLITKFLDALDAGCRSDGSWMLIGSDLMRAAVTLQRLPEFRERGMEIFERLLARGAYGVEEVLLDLDGRPRRGHPRASSPRRFRPKRGRS